MELQKFRKPEQIAPGSPRAKCSPHQSYPSGSTDQNPAGLAESQPAPILEQQERAVLAQGDPPLKVSYTRLTRPAPWKLEPVMDAETTQMQAHLKGIANAYPSAEFGPASQVTARDIVGAAKIADPRATPDDIGKFLGSEFRDRRPYPYENGLQTFGGMLIVVLEDFGAWFRAHPVDAAGIQPNGATPTLLSGGCEHITPAPPNTPARTVPVEPPSVNSPPPPAGRDLVGLCVRCRGKGYRIADSGKEYVGGTEFKTVAAQSCECATGREIGYPRLADIERKEAARRGTAWIAAHRPFRDISGPS